MRGDFRRVLQALISINNHKVRVFHQAQDDACTRYRCLGHMSNNTEACDAFNGDQNVVTIRSPKNSLSNYYICDLHIYRKTFKSSEHAFQWRLCTHVKRDDLAQEILNSPNPDHAKEIASRVPSHLRGTWHKIKCGIMEEILEAKVNSCSEFKQSLTNSLGKRLVEAVKSDIFWSSGLNPQEAYATKPHYYPGQNRLGYLLDQVRSNLLSRHKTKSNDEYTNVQIEEI